MTWWLVPSIIGVVLAGIGCGILIVYMVLKIRGQSFPMSFHRKETALAEGSAGQIEVGAKPVSSPEKTVPSSAKAETRPPMQAPKPAIKMVDKPVNNPPAKPVINSVDKPPVKPAAKPVEKPALRPVEKPAASRPVEKPVEKPIERPFIKPVEKPIEKPIDKAPEKPLEKPVEKPVERPIDRVVEKPIEKPVEKAAEKPLEKPVAKQPEIPVEKHVEKPVEKPAIESTPSLEPLKVEKAASTPPSRLEALAELEGNLVISKKPLNGQLVGFHTNIWNSRRSDFNVLEADLLREVTEAYVDMLLANNLVWLVTELKRDSPDLLDSYSKLSLKVSERLQRILPSIRTSFSK